MLRNTSDGNELALPAVNAYQRSIVWVDWYTVKGLVPGNAWVSNCWLLLYSGSAGVHGAQNDMMTMLANTTNSIDISDRHS